MTVLSGSNYIIKSLIYFVESDVYTQSQPIYVEYNSS